MKAVCGVKMLLSEYGYPFAQYFKSINQRLNLFFDFILTKALRQKFADQVALFHIINSQ
jgi:hypothetical protein